MPWRTRECFQYKWSVFSADECSSEQNELLCLKCSVFLHCNEVRHQMTCTSNFIVAILVLMFFFFIQVRKNCSNAFWVRRLNQKIRMNGIALASVSPVDLFVTWNVVSVCLLYVITSTCIHICCFLFISYLVFQHLIC